MARLRRHLLLPLRILRRIDRLLFGVGAVAREARAWSGTDVPGGGVVRLARYGDCSWRRMDSTHGAHTPVGYPVAAADRLAEHGLSMRFSDVFAPRCSDLPRSRADLARHLRLDAAPDAVLLHFGGFYLLRHLLPNTPRVVGLRTNLARRLGPRARPFYWLMRRLLPLVGRPFASYRGTQEVDDFVAAVRGAWPNAAIAIVPPAPVLLPGIASSSLTRRLRDDLLVAAARNGVRFIDPGDELLSSGRDAYCLNGWNQTTLGSAIVGEALAAWLAEVHDASAAAEADSLDVALRAP